MLYNLIQKRRGKDTVVMTDTLPNCNDRMKTLRKSHRKGVNGEKVEYRLEPSETVEKYKKKPHNLNLSGQPRRAGPPKIP